MHNKKQNVVKKRWLQGYNKKLEKIFCQRLKNEIGDFKMDNLKAEMVKIFMVFSKKVMHPIGLHVDAGFNFDNLIYKQTLIPLTPVGSTVIFKNRFYGGSTNFTLDEKELGKKVLTYGQNKRSSEHINMYGKNLLIKKYIKISVS